jgi:urease accessory protein
VRASARLRAELVGGRTRCTTLRSAPPLTFRETPEGLFLVGTAAGPLGGDELELVVDVGPGATLTVRSVAAQLAQPGPRAGAPSSLRVEVTVAAGAELAWLPEPTVAVRGCHHRVTTVIRCAAGARLVWRDEVVLGRHREASGSILQRLRVDRAGRPLLRHDLALGPDWPSSAGPAVLGPARAVGSLVTVGIPEGDGDAGTGPGRRAVTVALDAESRLTTIVTLEPSYGEARRAG